MESNILQADDLKKMEQVSQFSTLIERIYDASLDSSLWPAVLELICVYLEGCAAVLFYEGIAGLSSSMIWSWGEDLHYQQLYIDKYIKLNPLHPATLFFDVGKVYALEDAMPIEEFRQTRLYKEWARPQGILDALRVNLERTATGAAAVMIRRRERDGLFDADAKERCALIVPHLRRAIAIGKIVEFHQARASALTEALDGLETAVLLVARDGRLVHLNKAGATMLTATDTLRALRGVLTAADARVNIELKDAIGRAARGDAGLGTKGVAISLAPDDRTSRVAHVLSLVSGRRRELLDSHAVAAVFVRDMTAASPTPLELLAPRYGLTAAEVRVLASLAASSGVADMARMLGIGEATVKTHLHRLFAKTGTKRQADLIKLMMDPGSPL